MNVLLAWLAALWRSVARRHGTEAPAAGGSVAPYAAAVASAEEQVVASRADLEGPDGSSRDPAAQLRVARALLEEDDALRLLERHGEALARLDELLARVGDAPEGELEEAALRARQLRTARLLSLDRFADVVAEADALLPGLETAPKGELRDDLTVRVLTTRAWAQHKLGKSAAALEELWAAVARYGAATAPAVEHRVAIALLRIAVILDDQNDPDGAEAARRQAIERYGSSRDPRVREAVAGCLYNAARVARAAGDTEKALARLDEVIARAAAVPLGPEDRVTAHAEYLRGTYLNALERREAGAAAMDTWIARYDSDPRPAMQERVARLQYLRATQAPDKEQVATSMDAWAGRFDVPDTPVDQRLLVQGLTFRGAALAEADRSDEAIAACTDVIDRFLHVDDDRVADRVRAAWTMRIEILDHSDRRERAVEDARALVERYGEDPDPALREPIIYALAVQAAGLWHLQRPEAEIAVLREVLTRFGGDAEPSVHGRVLRAADRLIGLLAQLERPGEAAEVVDELTAEFTAALDTASDDPGTDADGEIASRAEVLLLAAAGLVHAGQPGDALPAVITAGDRLRGSADAALRTLSTKGDMYRVAALIALGHDEEGDAFAQDIDFGTDAMPILDEMADRSRNLTPDDAFLRAQLPMVLGLRAQSLQKVGRDDEAQAAVDDLMTRFGDDHEPTWEALGARAAALYDVGRFADALTAVDELLERFGDSTDPLIVPLLAEVHEGRDELIEKLRDASA